MHNFKVGDKVVEIGAKYGPGRKGEVVELPLPVPAGVHSRYTGTVRVLWFKADGSKDKRTWFRIKALAHQDMDKPCSEEAANAFSEMKAQIKDHIHSVTLMGGLIGDGALVDSKDAALVRKMGWLLYQARLEAGDDNGTAWGRLAVLLGNDLAHDIVVKGGK